MTSDPEQLNVLVIDDDEQTRNLLVDVVARRGHQPVPASSAEEGLGLLPFWTFQVAFLDQHLPGMEGLVLGEYLRQNNPDMKIALVTGADDPTLEKQTRVLDITFIAKPFDVHAIAEVMEEYVTGAKSRAERRLARTDPDFGPLIREYHGEIAACFDMPGLPVRIEDRLVATIKRCLNDLRSVNRYTERDRVLALAGLVSAEVLGIRLPKLPSGRTPFEEYDAIMRAHGRRTEFDSARAEVTPER
jgi:CheY-like chemotaxis protein